MTAATRWKKSLFIYLILILFTVSCQTISASPTPTGTAVELSNMIAPTPPSSIPELINALSSANAEVRIGAANRLKTLGKAAIPAVPALTQNLQYENSEVRKAATEALGSIGAEAKASVPTIIVLLLTDSATQSRRQAAIALGSIGDVSSVPALAMGLNDQDTGVSIQCANSIAILTHQLFPEMGSTGYSVDKNDVPLIVAAARKWWQANGKYQAWIDL
jgi:hypothetical protein